jgi:hypothetical protein
VRCTKDFVRIQIAAEVLLFVNSMVGTEKDSVISWLDTTINNIISKLKRMVIIYEILDNRSLIF